MDPKRLVDKPKRLKEIAVGLFKHFKETGLTINAAAVAYNAFLALVPLTLALYGVAAMVGRSDAAVDQVEQALEPLVPGTVADFILGLLDDAADRLGDGSILFAVVSVLIALFLGSRAVATLQKALAFVQEETETRPGLQMRLVATGLTVAGGLTLVLTSLTLVVGGHIMQFLVEFTGVEFLNELWSWLRVPIAGAGLYGFVLLLYRFGPPQPLRKSWLAALVAAGGAAVFSLGFGLYLDHSPALGATFGILGAVAVALVWLYLGAIAILAGAVVVSEFAYQ